MSSAPPPDSIPQAVSARGPRRSLPLIWLLPALIATTNAPRWPNQRADFERIVSAVRAQLGEEEFAAAWAEGQATPVEQIIAEALEEAPGPR